MKPIKVNFTVYKKEKHPSEERDHMVGYDFEGTLIGIGLDCGDKGSWATGIVITPDGRFNNIPVERLTLSEPLKPEDWPA